MFGKLILFIFLLSFVSTANAAQSSINPQVPAAHTPLTNTVVQQNFLAAYNDINNIYGLLPATFGTVNSVSCITANGVSCTSSGGSTPSLTFSLGAITPSSVSTPNLTATSSFTATGLVTNADLANSSTTVNGQTCTLGSTCSITVSAGSVSIGTTTLVGSTTNYLLYSDGTYVQNESASGLTVGTASHAPASGITGTTLASNVVTSSLTTVGTIGTGVWNGTALTASYIPSGTVIGSTSPAQGDILYYTGAAWADLGYGTSGYFLKTQGASANPVWASVSGSGTVTSIATTSPITGGTITTTGTIACGSCVTSSSPSAGIAHFAGSTQAVTSSAVALTDMAQIATNTVLGNSTSGTANVAAMSVSGCSSSSSALIWTTNTGFGCNTAIAASTVTTNANLTGGVTSVGNAATVVTNANLTGVITSSGNATSIASQTGTGSTFVVSAGPSITGTLTGATSTWSGTVAIGSTSANSEALYVIGGAAADATVTALTISTATFTPTFNASNDFSITLVHASCPCTLANPSGQITPGQHGIIYVTQSATGSDTITTWGSEYLAQGGTSTITLSSGANAMDVLSYVVKDATHIVIAPVLNVSH